jgi:predicted secreted protein
MVVKQLAVVAGLLLAAQAHAQVGTSGSLVIVQATGEVRHANDEATVTFSVSESGRDKAALASLVNGKIKQGTATLRAQDSGATLKTENYSTIAIFKKGTESDESRDVASWRVVQTVQATTTNLAGLPKLVAAGQAGMALTQIDFHLSDRVEKQLEAERIKATYRHFNERLALIAGEMGRKASDATLESADWEGVGSEGSRQYVTVAGNRSRVDTQSVTEPSFEPGETTMQMRMVAKVRFK